MSDNQKKRKAQSQDSHDGENKRPKGRRPWDKPRQGQESRSIQSGDAGIWATCAMKKEAKSVSDLRDLFQEYASKLYGENGTAQAAEDENSDAEEADIEAEIEKELADIRTPATEPLFKSLKLDTQCLIFFRTRAPLEPVSFVHAICQDIAGGAQPRNLRYVKRLTPITAYEKATSQGLEAVAKRVIAPHFHGSEQVGKKFAIRPSIRNNKEFRRDDVIKSVASVVGPGHKVDLHGYDLLIIVEIYKNVIGMSVVGPDFERLKRFNIDELRQMSSAAAETNKNLVSALSVKEDA